MLKIIFMIKPNNGRIVEEDKMIIKLILQAAPEIGKNYTIM